MEINKINKIENYAKEKMTPVSVHNYLHIDRVRNWALKIAKKEGFKDLEIVEVVALLHDIGKPISKKESMHGEIGAKRASEFLNKNNFFDEQKTKEIAYAIRHHNSNKKVDGKLAVILRDADMMDLFGAIGIMRCIAWRASSQEYNPQNIKGNTWGAKPEYFDRRFNEGKNTGNYILDQLNFQISCYDNLNTQTAKKFAKPLVEYMKNYIIQFECEVLNE
ncbi:MAG: HD domain-containing protein [Candidatus Aenigmarchaeota archaeon]|nr:HD domain-containing protein [Candidatus Aenigmarchaeota archaeon]